MRDRYTATAFALRVSRDQVRAPLHPHLVYHVKLPRRSLDLKFEELGA